MKATIGKKIGMTQLINEDGQAVPVTLIATESCTVTQLKNVDTDGYEAVALGYGQDKKLNKAQQGHFKKAKVQPKKVVEFRGSAEGLNVGDTIALDSFEAGDKVTISGISKGKGFAGTVKRHNFNTGPKTHGSRNVREPGSIGSMYPQKIMKGKKMAGQMGYDKTTTKNVQVTLVDTENGVIGVKGAVPGPRKGYVTIRGIA